MSTPGEIIEKLYTSHYVFFDHAKTKIHWVIFHLHIPLSVKIYFKYKKLTLIRMCRCSGCSVERRSAGVVFIFFSFQFCHQQLKRWCSKKKSGEMKFLVMFFIPCNICAYRVWPEVWICIQLSTIEVLKTEFKVNSGLAMQLNLHPINFMELENENCKLNSKWGKIKQFNVHYKNWMARCFW